MVVSRASGTSGGGGYPSPNHGPRKDGLLPSLVVLHFTDMPSAAEARARLCDPEAAVSAHWLIAEDGTTEQLVDEARRAWHAGAGEWRGQSDINSRSIGIELANPGNRPYPEPQMAALEGLLRAIMSRWDIPPEGVIAHSDMAPGRKVDPGARFDWRRLALQGLSVWPEVGTGAEQGDPAAFLSHARAFGYPEAAPAKILHSFRLRFRPWGQGEVGAEDAGLAEGLARRYGSS
ncbi:N-acetylmuramoyl-L-alanine amidase [Acidimangrovimonas sediminis]|uniref:N-acetylmuramoyl-L-alanine amidase n=1 Tax=Acidimangrovimonas sediminis TaxID=2056283 RepID=UPI0022B86427|nr:N-acetylmuramoyl-L-alanine amidase [Acidimangrovimonas sediminis]